MSSVAALPVADFCKTGSGGTPDRSISSYYGGSIPWVKSGELRGATIVDTEEKITEDGLRESSAKLVPKGAILLAMYGATVGRVALLGVDAATNQAVCTIEPNPEIADARYVYHALQEKLTYFLSRAAGGAQPNISQAIVRDTKLALPPLDEQRRIAAILDKADALRRKRKRTLDLLDCLTQSIFQEMFGLEKYAEIELKDAVKTGTIVTYGIVQAGPEFESGVPYIRTSDLVNGSIDQSGLRHTDPKIASRFVRSRVEAGEIVMSIRATVGTTAIVPPALNGANLTQGTARIAPGDMVLVEYLLAYLRSEPIQRWLKAQVKGATFLEITLGRLRELPVAVPPAQLQREFAERIAAVRRALASTIAQNASLNGLFASLQTRAFSGQL